MAVIPITSIADERLQPYRDLPHSRLPRDSKLFIAEGRLLVERLLANDFRAHSVLAKDTSVNWFQQRLEEDVPVYSLPRKLIEEVIGFDFHHGLLACGYRKPLPLLDDAIPAADKPATIVVCVDIQDPENLGGILRNCAAFGVDTVILNSNSCDAFSRRVLRVSMGTAFQLRLVESADLATDLRRLSAEFDVELAATVLSRDAEPLATMDRPNRFGLLLGNEAHGLDETWQALCQRRVTIPMEFSTDSLNVAVASGIFLYHFSR